MIKNIFSVVLMASSAYAFEGQFTTEAEAIDNGVVPAVAGNQEIYSGFNAEAKPQAEVAVETEAKPQAEVAVETEAKPQAEVAVENKFANKELNEKVQPEPIKDQTGAAPTKNLAYTLLVGHFVQYPKLSLLTCTTYTVGGYWYGGLEFLTNKWYAMGLFTAASLTTHALGGLYNWYNPQVKNANSKAKA